MPTLQTLAQRIGPSLNFNLSGIPARRSFEAHAETPFLALDLTGALDEEGKLDGPARIVATTNRLSDVARESPFPLGAARLEGELRRARGTTAIALDAQHIDVLGQRTRLTGPAEAALTKSAFTLNADLRAPSNRATFRQREARTGVEYDLNRHRFALNRTDLTGDAIAMTAQGWVNGEDGEFAGQWRVRRRKALAASLRGSARQLASVS